MPKTTVSHFKNGEKQINASLYRRKLTNIMNSTTIFEYEFASFLFVYKIGDFYTSIE